MAAMVFANACLPVIAAQEGEAVMGRIRGRIVDEATGKPLAARVTIVPEGGQPLATRYPRWPGFWADGAFEQECPDSRATLTVSKGPEWYVERRSVQVPADGVAEVEVALARWVDMAGQGWCGGDSHIHPIHGEREYEADLALTALACRAEGLHYASAGQSWGQPYTLDALEAECRRLSTDDFTLWWNLEFPKTPYGHVWFVGARRLDGLAGGPANYPGLARLRAYGATACIAHPLRWWLDGGTFVTNMAAELPFDLVAGLVDAVDIMYDRADDAQAQQLWFLLLNMGYRLPGLAASDTCLDRPAGPIPGRFRTYTYIEGDFSIAKAAEALRLGRCFVTSGPFVGFDVSGRQVGEEIVAKGQPLQANIEAFCSGDPDERLREVQLIRGGQIVAKWQPDARRFATLYPIEERETTWYIVKCCGLADDQVAISSPIYFRAPRFRRPEPVTTDLTVTVTDEQGGALSGRLQVLDPLGEVIKEAGFDGDTELQVAPTSAIRVRVEGHEPVTKRIFEDTPLHQSVREIAEGVRQEKPLLERYTYEHVRQLAAAQTLEFVLQAAKEPPTGEEPTP